MSEDEARRRLAARGPAEPPPTSRSYASIVRANVFTVFNLILLVAGIATLAFGAVEDALFLAILVLNAGIGILQEVRAKQALDRLAALVAPTATVVRDGRPRRAPVEEIVVDDLVQLQAGDQVAADGELRTVEGLALDESILTGESDAVRRGPGEEVRSGSFAVEGAGSYVVTAVGDDSYAMRIAGEARAFRHPRSPLEQALDKLLFALVALIVPLGVLLGYALWERQTPIDEAVPTTVAAVVTLVPEGLILLTSVTFAVSALRMARRGALAQQLNAIESLASVDLVFLDKTGTLTEPGLRVLELVPAEGVDGEELGHALGRFAASATLANATLGAIRERFEALASTPHAQVPFSSRWRWSGVELDGTSYILGAPELFELGPLGPRADEEALRGRRVLAFGRSSSTLADVQPEEGPPGTVTTLGLVVLAEQLRPEASETVKFFHDQGVTLKVISGDRPQTVAAIARDVGISANGTAIDGDELPDDPEELRRLVLASPVVGRISPQGKRRVVEALNLGGRYVAMVGDGVNDVPALKAARLAIAQGTGTEMAKSVADVVLVSGDFAAVAPMVGEGRKVLRNLLRVAKLFVSKSVFAVVLIVSIGLTDIEYPLLPRHLSLAAFVTVGIPAFFLALAPSAGPYSTKGFLREVSRFAVPAGTAAGLAVVASYLFAFEVANMPLISARTVATTVLVFVGLYLVLALEVTSGVRAAAVSTLCGALVVIYLLALAAPPTRSFFELSAPSIGILITSIVGTAFAIGALWLTDDRFVPGRGAAAAGSS